MPPLRHPRFCPEAAQGLTPFSIVYVPDLVPDCRWGQRGVLAAGTDVVVLPPWTEAAPVAGLLQLLCPRSGPRLRCEAAGARARPLGKGWLCPPPPGAVPRGLSTGDERFWVATHHLGCVAAMSAGARPMLAPASAMGKLTKPAATRALPCWQPHRGRCSFGDLCALIMGLLWQTCAQLCIH